MNTSDSILKPTKEDQKTAMESYSPLEEALKTITTSCTEIEIDETEQKIKVPLSALKLLAKILKTIGEGKPISVVPLAAEVTTQVAAEILGCSRPHLVELLEKGTIPFTMIGRHRRIKYEDLHKYKKEMKDKQKALLIELMKADEDSGIYDS